MPSMGLESYREREGKRGGGMICTSPPPAPLVDLGDHDLHARVPMVKLVQVLLHHVQQLNTGHIPQVIAAAVDEEDIRGCSSSQGVGKKGRRPLQRSPPQPNQHTLRSRPRLLPMVSVALWAARRT
ncbi:hypothetical protein NQZ68_033869 [Dissostichus eleginoides]|nr:hypothetical protein NQZ68_033869 [Dissostichus eleginoides]